MLFSTVGNLQTKLISRGGIQTHCIHINGWHSDATSRASMPEPLVLIWHWVLTVCGLHLPPKTTWFLPGAVISSHIPRHVG